ILLLLAENRVSVVHFALEDEGFASAASAFLAGGGHVGSCRVDGVQDRYPWLYGDGFAQQGELNLEGLVASLVCFQVVHETFDMQGGGLPIRTHRFHSLQQWSWTAAIDEGVWIGRG